MTIMTLDKLNTGKSASIKSVGGQGSLRRRLLDLGLTPGTAILVRKVAPLGDPIEVYLRGYELTLRKEEASKIYVEILKAFQGSDPPEDSIGQEAKNHG